MEAGQYNSDPNQVEIIDTQLAASLMLCVYSVFDETEGNWHMHLDGARYMLQKLAASNRGLVQSTFLLTWFLYHEVLACFTQPLREDPQELDLLQLLESAGSDKTVIVGSLACSTEVIEIIHRINRIRATILRQPSENHKEAYEELTAQRAILEHRLNSLTQRLHPDEESSTTPFERTRILSTAELYRLAAYLYLLRALPEDGDNTSRFALMSQSLETLNRLQVATSPWPIFIVACEANDDDSRVQILRELDKMVAERGIGNVRVMKGIIEAFWKQVDLRADSAGGSGSTGRGLQGQPSALTWGDLVKCDEPVPWFV